MGFLDKWADGGSGKKSKGQDQLLELITKVRVLNKRLKRQASKMRKESEKARTQAKELLMEGEQASSKEFLLHALKYKKWAYGIDKFRLKMESLETRLKQTQMVSDFSQVAGDIATNVQELKETVNIPEIGTIMGQIDLGIEDFVQAQEKISPDQETLKSEDISQEEFTSAFEELGAEANIVLTDIPDPEMEGLTSEASEKTEELSDIDALEKELERLKK